jgi:hypothetical protein
LLDVNTGNTVEILNAYGEKQPWTTFSTTVPTTGLYKLVFIR